MSEQYKPVTFEQEASVSFSGRPAFLDGMISARIGAGKTIEDNKRDILCFTACILQVNIRN
jgi:hypothetical protein